jgi:hypothetical protein
MNPLSVRRLAFLAAVFVFGALALVLQSNLFDFSSHVLGLADSNKTRVNSASYVVSEPEALLATATSQSYLPLISAGPPAWAINYYVDSSSGNDRNTCTQAQNPSTPKKTVPGIMSCNPGFGQTVYFRGTFTDTILPNRSGTVLYNVQAIAEVKGSVVTFNQAVTGFYPPTDYVTVYGSRKGNSGAFGIVSVSGNQVTVDTTSLPGGKFVPESASDPGTLQAAILRPIHFTAWDKSHPPVFNTKYQVFHTINQRVLMVSYLKSIGGYTVNPGYHVWPAFEIDGNNFGNSDFLIFSHLEVINAESAIAVEFNDFQSNYDIIQFNNLHDTGSRGDASDEIIYWGNDIINSNRHHDFAQIIYNKVGPQRSDSDGADGIEIKETAQNVTVFGNEVVGIYPEGCSDAPIRVSGINAFIANNFVHDIHPFSSNQGCGISIVDDHPSDPTSGGKGAIIVNNIVANVQDVGIRVLDSINVQVLNNTIYNIFPRPNCTSSCMEEIMGIEVQNWQGATTNILIKNNIVQSAHIGIGRYTGSHNEYSVSIDSDYNIVFNADFPFRGTITQNTHDRVINPELVDPQNQNFALKVTSPARDSGIDLSNVFRIDNPDAVDPLLPYATAPTVRTNPWDRGAYEYR